MDGKLVSKTNPLLGIISEAGLEGTKVEYLVQQFTPFYTEAEKLVSKAETISVTDETQLEAMAEAGTIRKQLQKIRIESDKVRYALKEDSRKEGNAIQSIFNKLIEITGPVEEKLAKDEKFLEIKEAERKAAKLLDRTQKLSLYVNDVSFYNLKDISDEIFDKLLSDCKANYETEQARLKKIEDDRIAAEKKEKEIQDRRNKLFEIGLKFNGQAFIYKDINVDWTEVISLDTVAFDNVFVSVKKRKEEIDKQEADDAEKIRIENEKLKQENERIAAEKKVVEDKIAADKAAEEKKIKDAQDAEKAKIKAEEDAKLAATKAPDKEKLTALAKDIDLIMMPRVTSPEALEVTQKVQKMLNSVSDFVKEKAKTL